jgi:competence protein ComEC
VTVSGRLASELEPDRRGWAALVRPDPPAGRWLLRVTFEAGPEPAGTKALARLPGERLTFPARLFRPEAGNPGETPFSGLSPHGRVAALAWTPLTAVRWEAPAGRPALAERALQAVRGRVGAVMASGASQPGRGILRALTLGDRSELDEGVEEDFTRAGAVHLLVVSGLHLSVVAAFVEGLGRRAGLSLRGQALTGAAGAVAFATLTGWRPAVTRAALMSLLALGARVLGRPRDAERGLWWAVLAMLALQPLLFFDVGFRLTVAATWGVVAVTPLLSRRLGLSDQVGRGWCAAAAAQTVTAPLTLLYFGRAPLVALAGSPLLVGFGSLLVEGGVVAGLLGAALPPLGRVLSAGLGVGGVLLWLLARAIGRIPLAGLNLPGPPEWLVALYFAGLGWCRPWWESLLISGPGPSGPRPKLKGPPGRWRTALAVATLTVWALVACGASPWLQCTFLSVGEGDALHLRLPGGAGGPQVLVDAGASPSRPLTYLRRAAVQTLAAAILTHPHRDHAGGLAGILQGLPCWSVVAGGTRGRQGWTDTGAHLVVTAPATGAGNEACRRVVVRYGRFCLVDSGDAPLDAGDPALAWVPRRDGPEGRGMFLVVKVPHHGARGALTDRFLKVCQPDLAVISVGPNGYGHPAPELLALLQRSGIPVLRTDQAGAVRLATDGRRVRVRGYCR